MYNVYMIVHDIYLFRFDRHRLDIYFAIFIFDEFMTTLGNKCFGKLCVIISV